MLPAASAAASGRQAAGAQEPEVPAEGFPPGNASSSSDPGFQPGSARAGQLNGPEGIKIRDSRVSGRQFNGVRASPCRAGPQAGRRRPLPVPAAEGSVSPGPAAGRASSAAGRASSAAMGPPRGRWALLGGYGLSVAAVGPPQQQWPLLGGDGPSSAADKASSVAMGPLGGRKGLPRRREGCGYPRWFTNCWTRLIVLRQR